MLVNLNKIDQTDLRLHTAIESNRNLTNDIHFQKELDRANVNYAKVSDIAREKSFMIDSH